MRKKNKNNRRKTPILKSVSKNKHTSILKTSHFVHPEKLQPAGKNPELIRLNKYIANTGICSRREADNLIAAGVISVNGKIVTEMGIKISQNDIVKHDNKTLKSERKVYVLLNKPKDHITTLNDPQGRKTVFNLVKNACKERIYPVGRLDRNTTGLLLFTNDGELTKKLSHPKHGIKKIYHVFLDKKLRKEDLNKIVKGIELEDGKVIVDLIAYVSDGIDKKQVGIELHSGKNRVIHRIFDHLGYEVKKLDRVYYAGLTKKELPRGKWRFLTKSEAGMLMMIRG
ncbi:MAG: pseudouridine synthase [Bacteroidota bacterium]